MFGTQKLKEESLRKLLNKIPSLEKIWGELPYFSEDYVKEILSGTGSRLKNYYYVSNDYASDWHNVQNGFRVTKYTPDSAENKIYLLGSSFAYGIGSEDKHTIASFLQENLNKKFKQAYEVVNLGIGNTTLENSYLIFDEIALKAGDFIFLFNSKSQYALDFQTKCIQAMLEKCEKFAAKLFFVQFPHVTRIHNLSPEERKLIDKKAVIEAINFNYRHKDLSSKAAPELLTHLAAIGCTCLDMQHLFERPHRHGQLFIDDRHVSYKGNQIIADELFKIISLKQAYAPPLEENVILQKSLNSVRSVVLERCQDIAKIIDWADAIKCRHFSGSQNIGAIVMNCNPFTRGHLHLIETALTQAEYLYLFIVQENRSTFEFTDRFNMVVLGTKHLQGRLRVVPSGKFIISSFSFPEYFAKADIDYEIDPSSDVFLFGAFIAPLLNISHRFIGEEPFCRVTRQYNRTMQKILPKFAVQVHEYPRLKTPEEVVISASRVRQSFAEDPALLASLLPETTLKYLKNLPGQRQVA